MKEVELLSFDESFSYSSAMVIAALCMLMSPPQFIANHPFVFLINSIELGIVLFAGRLSHV
jgi:serine protease inhibitor